MRSSRIELACTSRASGSSATSASESLKGWTGSRWWPMTSAGAVSVRRSVLCGAVRPKNRPCRTAALGPGSWRIVSRARSASSGAAPDGTWRAAARDQAHDGLAEAQRDHERREGDRAAQQRVVEHRHVDDHAADALGRVHRGLERRVGPQRGPAQHGVVDLEVIEQGDHLLPEGRHRVARHVARAIRAPVAEQIERHHPVAALGQRARQRPVHLLRQQQRMDQDARARTLAIDRVGQPAAFEAEEGHRVSQDSRRAARLRQARARARGVPGPRSALTSRSAGRARRAPRRGTGRRRRGPCAPCARGSAGPAARSGARCTRGRARCARPTAAPCAR